MAFAKCNLHWLRLNSGKIMMGAEGSQEDGREKKAASTCIASGMETATSGGRLMCGANVLSCRRQDV